MIKNSEERHTMSSIMSTLGIKYENYNPRPNLEEDIATNDLLLEYLYNNYYPSPSEQEGGKEISIYSDCTIRAISKLLDIPYTDVLHNLINIIKNADGSRFMYINSFDVYDSYLDSHGYIFHICDHSAVLPLIVAHPKDKFIVIINLDGTIHMADDICKPHMICIDNSTIYENYGTANPDIVNHYLLCAGVFGYYMKGE